MKLFTYKYKFSSIKNERNARKMGAKAYKKIKTNAIIFKSI